MKTSALLPECFDEQPRVIGDYSVHTQPGGAEHSPSVIHRPGNHQLAGGVELSYKPSRN
jgi:hypothetical protein